MPLLPPIRLTGALILRDGAMLQRSVAIERGRISKGPLPAVDLQEFLILPGIVDLLFRIEAPEAPALALRRAARDAARAGITTCWIAPRWSWADGHDSPQAAAALLSALHRSRTAGLRPALRLEPSCTDSTQAVLELCQRLRVELTWFESDLPRLDDLQRQHPHAFAAEAARLGMTDTGLRQALQHAATQLREVPRHLCRLAEGFDAARTRYGSIGDTDGAQREMHSMIGASLAACPATYPAAAAARAMGDPVLLSAAHPKRLADLLRGGLGNAIVSDGAAQDMVRQALHLAGPDLADLPRIWALLSQHPAEIMHLSDRGRLDLGSRADLVIIHRASGQVQATVNGGRLTCLTGIARDRFAAAQGQLGQGGALTQIAAE